MPLIGPGENECTGATHRERRSDLPVERACLGRLAVPSAVQPDFRHDQGSITRQVLQTAKISFKARLRLEEHVEAYQVKKGQIQILCGGIVCVGKHGLGIFVLGHAEQVFNEPFDPVGPVPPHDVPRDLVGERVAQNRRMAGAGTSAGAHLLLDVLDSFQIVEEGKVTLSLQSHHDAQALLLGHIEQPSRR